MIMKKILFIFAGLLLTVSVFSQWPYNTVYGTNALSSNTTGVANSAFGYNSLMLNTTGSDNTAVGYAAANSTTTGGANTALGAYTYFSTECILNKYNVK